jgi:hypothetical protein
MIGHLLFIIHFSQVDMKQINKKRHKEYTIYYIEPF